MITNIIESIKSKLNQNKPLLERAVEYINLLEDKLIEIWKDRDNILLDLEKHVIQVNELLHKNKELERELKAYKNENAALKLLVREQMSLLDKIAETDKYVKLKIEKMSKDTVKLRNRINDDKSTATVYEYREKYPDKSIDIEKIKDKVEEFKNSIKKHLDIKV